MEDNFRKLNICIIGVAEGEKRGKNKNILEEIFVQIKSINRFLIGERRWRDMVFKEN